MNNVLPARLSGTLRKKKLKQLADLEGQGVMSMLDEASTDSVAKAICIHTECDYTCEMEPDQDRGWCPECKANTVQSCLMLYGLG